MVHFDGHGVLPGHRAGGDVLGEPVADLGPKLLLVLAELEIHRRGPSGYTDLTYRQITV